MFYTDVEDVFDLHYWSLSCNVGAHFIKFDSLVDVGRIKRKCRGTEKITLSFSEPEWLIVLSDI